ncbi:MAG TPA: OadG family protein [Ohtaekwangia sp.]|nr:OadG family protein [Ohtaekwangia sp.]
MDFRIENIGNEHLIIVIVGYVIVFTSLFILWLVFYNLPKLLNIRFDWFAKISTRTESAAVMTNATGISITGEETAAISAAIFLFVGELHDTENTVLTIQKISKRYSPWNSKIYNVINGLNKRF